jgi:hypothetical protein
LSSTPPPSPFQVAIPVRVDPIDADELAQDAVPEEGSHLLVARLGPQLEHAGKDGAGIVPGRRNEPFGVGFVRGNRLLDQGVHAGLERGHAQGGVLEVRRGDEDRIHLAGADERLAVGEGLQGLVTVERRGGVAHRDQFAAFDLAASQILGVVAADVAHANDAQSNGVHTMVWMLTHRGKKTDTRVSSRATPPSDQEAVRKGGECARQKGVPAPRPLDG